MASLLCWAFLDYQPQLGLAPGGLGHHLWPLNRVPDASLKGASFLSQGSEIPKKAGIQGSVGFTVGPQLQKWLG